MYFSTPVLTTHISTTETRVADDITTARFDLESILIYNIGLLAVLECLALFCQTSCFDWNSYSRIL